MLSVLLVDPLFLLLLMFVGFCVRSFLCNAVLIVLSSFAFNLAEEERAVYFTLIVLLVSCGCYLSFIVVPWVGL